LTPYTSAESPTFHLRGIPPALLMLGPTLKNFAGRFQ
jgi:hypothetical protein